MGRKTFFEHDCVKLKMHLKNKDLENVKKVVTSIYNSMQGCQYTSRNYFEKRVNDLCKAVTGKSISSILLSGF